MSAQSSGSSKQKRLAQNSDFREFVGAVGTLNDSLSIWRQPPPQPPPPPPVPAAAPLSLENQLKAGRIFYKRFTLSKTDGDEWLSKDDAAKVFEIMRNDPSVARFYLILVESPTPDESFIRSWVHQLLSP